MALWSTFKWSDGTKWADGYGTPSLRTTFIDRPAFYLSLRITKTYSGSQLSPPSVLTVSVEAGPRAQFNANYMAFIDRNEETQRISAKITMASGDAIAAFSIDKVHILVNQRSRVQPSS